MIIKNLNTLREELSKKPAVIMIESNFYESAICEISKIIESFNLDYIPQVVDKNTIQVKLFTKESKHQKVKLKDAIKLAKEAKRKKRSYVIFEVKDNMLIQIDEIEDRNLSNIKKMLLKYSNKLVAVIPKSKMHQSK